MIKFDMHGAIRSYMQILSAGQDEFIYGNHTAVVECINFTAFSYCVFDSTRRETQFSPALNVSN